MQLREGLSGYMPDTQAGHLILHELGELIRRAGKEAGFVVLTEVKVDCRDGLLHKIDWVWLDAKSKEPIVAFEIEGRDVARKSQRNDFRRFTYFAACINVLVLYQVDHNHLPKRLRSVGPIDWVKAEFQKWRESWNEDVPPIDCPQILLDSDLMAEDGIENLQRRAKDAHAKDASTS